MASSGSTRQLTVAAASCGSAFLACPPSSWVATHVVRSVAFQAVQEGIDRGLDTVLVDTAGRLQNKAGLMDELGKVKRVIEKQAPVSEHTQGRSG